MVLKTMRGAFMSPRGKEPEGSPMLSLQQLAEIAGRYLTAMADAMVAACVAKSIETGDGLDIPERRSSPGPRGERPTEDVDWEEMVTRNSDSRWQHL